MRRPQLVYLLWPAARGRWCTGISEMRAPAMPSRAGMKRCRPRNWRGRWAVHSARNALRVQPVSRMVSRRTRLRTVLASRLPMRLDQTSCRWTRYPQQRSQVASSSIRAGMSEGSFWPSASSVTKIRPRAVRKAACRAALWPELVASRRARSSGTSAHRSFRRPGVQSLEASSTTTISNDRPSPCRTQAVSRTTAAMQASSL